MYNSSQKKFLLNLAKKAIENKLNKTIKIPNYPQNEEIFTKPAMAFVTLHKNNSLRGCIGYVQPVYNLYNTIIKASTAAAFDDPRFSPVTINEIPEIKIEISILTPFKLINSFDEIIIGTHGLFLKTPLGSGLLLPQVAVEYNWNVKQFLQNCSLKAGLQKNYYENPNTKIYTFKADIINEL